MGRRVLLVLFGISLFTLPCVGKSKKIHGYVTVIESPTKFEIEDYKISRDTSLVLDFEKSEMEPGVNFKPEDIRIGTELEIKGEYNEQSGELKAESIKVFLDEHKRIKRTALIERAPQISKIDGNWEGLFFADGQKIKVVPGTAVSFQPNKSEKKAIKQKKKTEKVQKSATDATPDPTQENSEPLTSLDQVSSDVFMTYEGVREKDGTITASKLAFVKNERESGELKLWKDLEPKEKQPDYENLKPGELKARALGKYKLVPNREAQAYVQHVGERLIPNYAGPHQTIPFRFFLVEDKNPNAFAAPNGVVVLNSSMFEVLENEDQLAAVIGHEIAHAVQKHTWRQLEYHKKSLTALKIGGAFAAGMGYGGIANVASMIEGAVRNGYARSLENQADRIGLEYMLNAGYDIREAPSVWKVMTRKLGDHSTNVFWSNHDNNTTRRSYLMAELRNNYSDQDFGKVQKRDTEFKNIAQLVKDATEKKKKVKVKY